MWLLLLLSVVGWLIAAIYLMTKYVPNQPAMKARKELAELKVNLAALCMALTTQTLTCRDCYKSIVPVDRNGNFTFRVVSGSRKNEYLMVCKDCAPKRRPTSRMVLPIHDDDV